MSWRLFRSKKTFFIEGVWNSEFEKENFDQTECIFGSGAVLKNDSIVFVSSASTTDGLYYYHSMSNITISNSLPFILAYIGDELDPNYRTYDFHNESILKGINKYEKDLVTKKGKIKHLFYRNLIVNNEGFRENMKPIPPNFATYKDYYNYLNKNYKLIAKNAKDKNRKIKIDIFSTQSKGYDTTAINAIASQYGIDKVFTCTKSKGKGAFANKDKNLQQDDDGTQICNVLGLNCIPIDRKAYEKGFNEEYLYHSGQHANQDTNLLEINNYIKKVSILLTGNLGEIWYTEKCLRKTLCIDSDLKRMEMVWDLGGHGLSEIRLCNGFIQLPFPYLGAQRREDIYRITNSSEMDKWRLNNDYDRPIPRRIAEEKGVPRELFGQSKLASVVEFPPPNIPYNRSLRKEYFKFLTNNKILSKRKIVLYPLIHFINTILIFKKPNRYRIVYYIERVISKIINKEYKFPLLWKELNGSLFCFAVNKRANDYKLILKK